MKVYALNSALSVLLLTLSLPQILARGETEQPRVVQAVAPLYPILATQVGASGTVIIEARIDADGRVASTRVVKGGFKQLRIVSEMSARRWRFAPAAKNTGRRVVRLTFTFKLMPKETALEELWPTFVPPYAVVVYGVKPVVLDTRNRNPIRPKAGRAL